MSVHISRILHAGYIFKTSASQILFDPIFESPFSRNCYSYPKIEFDLEKLKAVKFAAVFISHHHDDHCSLESLQYIDRKTPIYLYCLQPELFEWLKALGFIKVVPLALGLPIFVDDFKITPTRALDKDVDCIFQVEAYDLKILNVVDAWMDEATLSELKEKSPWDVVLWPFQTFRELEILSPSRFDFSQKGEIPFEFIEQLQALNPRYVVPSSCQFRFEDNSWLNDVYFPIRYSEFTEFISKVLPKKTVLRIEPGETFTLTAQTFNKSTSLPWVHLCESKTVDYGFNKNATIPSLSDWSITYANEHSSTQKTVSDFCGHDIFEKFKNISFEDNDYFSSPKIWRLTVYSTDGTSNDYFYQICKNQLSKEAPCRFSDWHTEIIDMRLLGALYNGESLSSLYLRINNKPEVLAPEFDFEAIDVLWDPLLSLLYSGQFRSYQKAQLDRLLSSPPIV